MPEEPAQTMKRASGRRWVIRVLDTFTVLEAIWLVVVVGVFLGAAVFVGISSLLR